MDLPQAVGIAVAGAAPAAGTFMGDLSEVRRVEEKLTDDLDPRGHMRFSVRNRAAEKVLADELPDGLDARGQRRIGELRSRNLDDQTAALAPRVEAQLNVVIIIVDLTLGPLQVPGRRHDLAFLIGEVGDGRQPLVLKITDLMVRNDQVRQRYELLQRDRKGVGGLRSCRHRGLYRPARDPGMIGAPVAIALSTGEHRSAGTNE